MSTTSPTSSAHHWAGPVARRRRGLRLAAVVLACLAALTLATWVAAASQPPGQRGPWRENLALALMVTGAIAAVAGMVWMLALGTFTSGDLGHIRSASRARRAAATTAIRHGRPVPADEVELTHALARATVHQRAAAPTWLGVLATTTGMLLLTPGMDTAVLIAAVLVLVGTAANIPTVIAVARARRWLESAHHQHLAR